MSATIGVYVFRSASDEVLYVGSTNDVATRVRQHKARDWWGAVARIEFHPTSSRAEAYAHEVRLIRELQPLHNIARPRSSGSIRPKVQPPAAPVGAARVSLGLTRAELARRMADSLGRSFDEAGLADIESGHLIATDAELLALASALGVKPGTVTYGKAAA